MATGQGLLMSVLCHEADDRVLATRRIKRWDTMGSSVAGANRSGCIRLPMGRVSGVRKRTYMKALGQAANRY